MDLCADRCAPKEDPNWIRIAVGGNLITYKGSTSTHTADLTTSKLLWNSVLSTEGANNMCNDIKKNLPHGGLVSLQLYENPTGPLPGMDQKQFNQDTTQRME